MVHGTYSIAELGRAETVGTLLATHEPVHVLPEAEGSA
jgi:hypothetical protein